MGIFAQRFYGEMPAPTRYVRSANGTESWTPRYRTTAWDHEMRNETVAVPRNIRMAAKYNGRCVECGGSIEAGTEIEYNPTARKAMHVTCPKIEAAPATIVKSYAPGNSAEGNEAYRIANAADDLLAEYDRLKAAEPASARRPIPEGRYTVRPADEKVASVLSIAAPSFGTFEDGTRAVKLHGNFGESVASWYGFAIVRPDGRISLYKNARAIMDAPTAGTADEQHLRSKIRAAMKALRLMIDAGTTDLLEYGKAYASAENHCFVCRRPLLDETSQQLGIGPVCLKKFGA